ncbi:MAG: hypothetical protein OXG83_03770 [Acidobacteria bacterium]|nr:hypothetical protein [Acidobacteriota bacterium]
MSHERQRRATGPEGIHRERMPGIEELRADLPVSAELRAGLLEIAVGAPYEPDGEARVEELEPLVGSELEPPPALMRRLRAIPASHRAHRPAGFGATPRTATALAASYVLAVALTLLLGDPVAAGREAATNLGAAAGEHLLEPVAEAGSSMHAEVTRRLEAVQELRPPAGLFDQTLGLPTDRVRGWFRAAVDSSSEAVRDLAALLTPGDSGADDPTTTRDGPPTYQERSSA